MTLAPARVRPIPSPLDPRVIELVGPCTQTVQVPLGGEAYLAWESDERRPVDLELRAHLTDIPLVTPGVYPLVGLTLELGHGMGQVIDPRPRSLQPQTDVSPRIPARGLLTRVSARLVRAVLRYVASAGSVSAAYASVSVLLSIQPVLGMHGPRWPHSDANGPIGAVGLARPIPAWATEWRVCSPFTGLPLAGAAPIELIGLAGGTLGVLTQAQLSDWMPLTLAAAAWRCAAVVQVQYR